MEHGDNESKVVSLSQALASERVRLARWLAACCLFAVLVTPLAVLTKSVVFSLVAVLAWFFVWNRWKCWKFVGSVAAKPLPSSDAERMQWLHNVMNAFETPPQWWRVSEYAAAVILLGLYAVVSFIVVTTSGTWMKVFYGLSWAAIVAAILSRVHYMRKRRAAGNN